MPPPPLQLLRKMNKRTEELKNQLNNVTLKLNEMNIKMDNIVKESDLSVHMSEFSYDNNFMFFKTFSQNEFCECGAGKTTIYIYNSSNDNQMYKMSGIDVSNMMKFNDNKNTLIEVKIPIDNKFSDNVNKTFYIKFNAYMSVDAILGDDYKFKSIDIQPF